MRVQRGVISYSRRCLSICLSVCVYVCVSPLKLQLAFSNTHTFPPNFQTRRTLRPGVTPRKLFGFLSGSLFSYLIVS